MSSAIASRRLVLRRIIAWLLIPVLGNAGILGFAYVYSTPPFNTPFEETLAFLHELAAPVYAPTLLFFTAVLGVLSALQTRSRAQAEADDESDEANRLIARAVQLALSVVLSFAAVVAIVDIASLRLVLFAVLLSFVTFVLADRIAPPRTISAEVRYQRATAALTRQQEWAERALGPSWNQEPFARIRPLALTAALTPVLLTSAAGFFIARAFAGVEFALSTQAIVVHVILAYGALLLLGAWYVMADKAESPQARAWQGGGLIAVALLVAAALSSIFFSAEAAAHPYGWLVLAATALQAVFLWAPRRWIWRRWLDRVSARITEKHLRRTRDALTSARAQWEAEQPSAGPLKRAVRGLRRALRPSRSASDPKPVGSTQDPTGP